ncbi:hypothetical protein RNZ50_08330 [Paracoccaceae bacterium Fryx2]|nr:hypothetical protein [Paracoccaceae bacterium Fryx2]
MAFIRFQQPVLWQNSQILGYCCEEGPQPSALRVIACRLATDSYKPQMVKRTSPSDAQKISVAADLEELVQDKREGWRASGAKARRRQRRYKALLTQQLMKVGTSADDDESADGDD